jgi:LPXTG-motif cell wall-anchored protein
MSGSGGGGFVIDTATLFLGVLGFVALGVIWMILLRKRR